MFSLSPSSGSPRASRLRARWALPCICAVLAAALLLLAGPEVAAAAGARQIGECENHAGNECDAAGQLFHPVGVAVDNDPLSPAAGGLYVADTRNWRVDSFAASSGAFRLAWGSGVASGARELQTCRTSCREGVREETPPIITGGVSFVQGVAVDSDELSFSAGDVYIAVAGSSRVEKFGPEGEFLLTFGGEVNRLKSAEFHEPGNPHGITEAEEDLCAAGEECQQGTIGSANGEFRDLRAVTVGQGGRVYVGDSARVEVFEPSGAFRETISLAGLSSSGIVTGLAVDASGDVFVADEGVPGVREFEPGGTAKSCVLDEGSTSVVSLAIDPSTGDVYVGDSDGGSDFGFHVLRYSSACKQVGDFGSGTVRGGGTEVVNGKPTQRERFFPNGMAFSTVSASPELFVSESFYEKVGTDPVVTTEYSAVWVLPVPPPGPVVERVSAKPEPRGAASLEASVNPEGNESEYHFDYVSEAEFQSCGWSCGSVAHTPAAKLPQGLKGVLVSARVTGLAVSTAYRFRVVASDVEGSAEAQDSFQTLAAALLESEYATDVSASSATLAATVNPLESATEFRLEYGLSTAYEHAVSGDAGEGTVSVVVQRHPQELAPASTYHYRFVLRNALGSVVGPDQTFTSQPAGAGFTLPDGRGWELVSPPDRKGALIEPRYTSGNTLQAASRGGAITYMTFGQTVGENPQGHSSLSQILSTRTQAGVWRSADLTLPNQLPEEGTPAWEGTGALPEYRLFSEDLALAAVEPQQLGTPPLTPEATQERTLYLRDSASGAFTPLVTCADVLSPCPTFGEAELGRTAAESPEPSQLHFITATPDLAHVVLGSPFALTEQANETYQPNGSQWNLYEWSRTAGLQLVNVLPNGHATSGSTPTVRLADGGDGFPSAVLPSAVSHDGRRVAWDLGIPFLKSDEPQWRLFVRDMVAEQTVQVGGSHAVFQWMSSDGSRVFYLEGGDLHLCELKLSESTGALECSTSEDLTAAHGPPAVTEEGAGVQEIVSDVSADGSYVYFVATSALQGTTGALAGADNLYVAHADGGVHHGGGGSATTFIATLSHEDEKDWKQTDSKERGANGVGHESDLTNVSSRVSPNGRYLAFMSQRPLTGYDNLDAASGQPDEEVFVYDAVSGRLACASCNPTGARPTGVLDRAGALLVDRQGLWTAGFYARTDHWLAALIPTWDQSAARTRGLYQPRYLSDSGRLFFDSSDALVPQDTNGVMDVYEYEPPSDAATPASDSCTTASPAFSDRSGGCVSLLSSGTSSGESAFLDASETGDDAFFLTASQLGPADHDSGYDVYDAHVCGSEGIPCPVATERPPPCSSGDSCKPAPAPQPEIFGAGASETFSGQGNNPPPPPAATAPKPPNRAGLLAKALATCRHKYKHSRKRRAACEKRAKAHKSTRQNGRK